ncbi:hypothetical protein FQA39_LY17825 [Lamprigera yunnana]|nr:hypothetical protein FQA39_LY17825 [Lamprigera yunnana]
MVSPRKMERTCSFQTNAVKRLTMMQGVVTLKKGTLEERFDTCAEYDYLNVTTESSKVACDETDMQDLETKKALHQKKATSAQEKLKNLSKLAESLSEKYHVMSADLQQALHMLKLVLKPLWL